MGRRDAAIELVQKIGQAPLDGPVPARRDPVLGFVTERNEAHQIVDDAEPVRVVLATLEHHVERLFKMVNSLKRDFSQRMKNNGKEVKYLHCQCRCSGCEACDPKYIGRNCGCKTQSGIVRHPAPLASCSLRKPIFLQLNSPQIIKIGC